MLKDYNPYSDIQKVYNAKVAWNNATTDEERKRQNEIAASARKTLESYGYGDVANQISASGADATAARKIMEKYSSTTPTTSVVKSATPITSGNRNTLNKNSTTASELVSQQNKELFKKLSEEYDDLKETNPFETDTAKAVLEKYDLAGLQGRDNAVASVGASNGGNIDSFAAANALRQQASLVNQGQMVVLEEHQQKLDHARNLLADMGVHIDRVYNQDETSKNNDVARKSEIASVTGNVPREWTYENNIYLNSDGTVRQEYLSDEFDSTGGFTTIINNAKSRLATTTDPTERANLQATINYATQAKALKTFSSPKYSKYSHEVESVAPQKTADYDLTDKQIQSAEKIALGEAQSNALSEAAKADAEYQKAYLGYMGDVYTADKKYEKEKADDDFVNNAITTHGNLINHFRNITGGGTVATFVDKFFTPDSKGMYGGMSEDAAILCIEQNIHRYNIDKADAEKICDELGINKSWLDDYRERKESDGGETVDGESKTWIQSGMIKKKK